MQPARLSVAGRPTTLTQQASQPTVYYQAAAPVARVVSQAAASPAVIYQAAPSGVISSGVTKQVYTTTASAPVTSTVVRAAQVPARPSAAGVPLAEASAPLMQSTIRVQPQTTVQVVSSQTRPNTLAGPAAAGLPAASPRRTCGLKHVPVADGLSTLKLGAQDGKLTRQQFLESYEALLQAHGVQAPEESVRNAVFNLFDRDENHVVDMMELICGISLLCAGSEEDKIQAVFQVFDENSDGYISMDEMFKFLTSVFKVVLTPNVVGVMSSMGVGVDSPEDLASVTALECFKTADLNHDGKLSVTEFKNWFYTPRNDPSSLFTPVRRLLQ